MVVEALHDLEERSRWFNVAATAASLDECHAAVQYARLGLMRPHFSGLGTAGLLASGWRPIPSDPGQHCSC